MNILILGGTAEATSLAKLIAADKRFSAVLSLAGRTERPAPQALPVRVGGFGGVDGLAAYLTAHGIDALIDATHPFAEQMSANAFAATQATGVRLITLTRPSWQAETGDRWTEVFGAEAAARAIGEAPKRVFLTVGRLQAPAFAACPQHDYLIRMIDPPEHPLPLPNHRILLARGPYDPLSEEALMRDHAIEVLVTKNSGGPHTYGKIIAARALGLPVILMATPLPTGGEVVHSADAALAALTGPKP